MNEDNEQVSLQNQEVHLLKILFQAPEEFLKRGEGNNEGSCLSDLKIICKSGTVYYSKLLFSVCLPYLLQILINT